MSIRAKLALLSISMTAATLLICGVLLIGTTARRNVQAATDGSLAELNLFCTAFESALQTGRYYGAASGPAQNSLALYQFETCIRNMHSDAQYILMEGEETLYNNTGISPDSYAAQAQSIPYDDGHSYPPKNVQIITLHGKNGYTFLASMPVTQGGEALTISIVRDVSEVYAENRALMLLYIGIAAAAFAASSAAILLATRKMLRPLSALQRAAVGMAQGEYNGRIDARGSDEIAALAQSFNAMAASVEAHVRQLEETAEERRMLLGALSHELKTPMTAIIGYADSLQRIRLSPAQREEAIAYIGSECQRLERLTQKLIRLIALSDGEETALKTQSTQALFDAAGATMRALCAQRGVSLTMEHGGQLLPMDVDLMASAVLNLFDNACKAGAKHISFTAQGCALTMQDDGKGISAKDLPRVTQPFFMGDASRSRKSGGAGLGLALVARIAELHGAALSFESEPGKGTIATITFTNC